MGTKKRREGRKDLHLGLQPGSCKGETPLPAIHTGSEWIITKPEKIPYSKGKHSRENARALWNRSESD
jgi:hypothetical protein